MKKIILSLIFAALCGSTAFCVRIDGDNTESFCSRFVRSGLRNNEEEDGRRNWGNLYPYCPFSNVLRTISSAKFMRINTEIESMMAKQIIFYEDKSINEEGMDKTQNIEDIKKIMFREYGGPFIIVMEFMDFQELLKLKKVSKYFYKLFWSYGRAKKCRKLSIKVKKIDKFLKEFLMINGHKLILFFSKDICKHTKNDSAESEEPMLLTKPENIKYLFAKPFISLMLLFKKHDKTKNIERAALIKRDKKIDGMQALKRYDFLSQCKKVIDELLLLNPFDIYVFLVA
jgi:hypothetical protein